MPSSLHDDFNKKCRLATSYDCVTYQVRKADPSEILVFIGEQNLQGNVCCDLISSNDYWYWVCGRTDGMYQITLDIAAKSRNNQIEFEVYDPSVNNRIFNSAPFETKLVLDVIYQKSQGVPPPDMANCKLRRIAHANRPIEQIVTQVVYDPHPPHPNNYPDLVVAVKV